MSDLNPYEAHPSLSQLEAAVLWEYAKLAQNVRMVTQKTRLLTEEPDRVMLAKLRTLEKKMGLVLTLACIHHVLNHVTSSFQQFKASVWGVINEQPEPDMQSTAYSDPNDTTIMR